MLKPNGITMLTPENFKEKIKDLDITCIPGIGKKSKVHYYKKGIKTIGDIIKTPVPKMIEFFGKHGKWISDISNARDYRNIQFFNFSGGRKSISAERTFYEDTSDFNFILSKLEDINKRIHKFIIKNNISYKTITLKIRFEGFKTYTRARTLTFPIQDPDKVLKVVLDLYKEFANEKKKTRLVGIKLSNLEKNSKAKQTSLLQYS
jgi:DNA polymerase IV (DinB-like DNA polymerase)